MARKKIKPVFEELYPPRLARVFGCCRTAPHLIREYLNAQRFFKPIRFLHTTQDVDDALAAELDADYVYVCTSARLVRRLYEDLTPDVTVICCDSALASIALTQVFLDTDAALSQGGAGVAWHFTPADRWSLIWSEPFKCLCGKYDHPRALISDGAQGSLLMPFFSVIYKLPKDLQAPVKDVVVTTIMDYDRDTAKTMLAEKLPPLIGNPKQVQAFMKMLFEVEHNYLAALVDVRPYAHKAIELKAFPGIEIAKKHDVDPYELRYFFQVYKKIRLNNGTVTLDDGFFNHRDALIADGQRRRGNVTANLSH